MSQKYPRNNANRAWTKLCDVINCARLFFTVESIPHMMSVRFGNKYEITVRESRHVSTTISGGFLLKNLCLKNSESTR